MNTEIPLDGYYHDVYSTKPVILSAYNNRQYNHSIMLGQVGVSRKIITFKEREFEKELAPKNASIKYEEINGEKFVIMAY